MVKNKLFCSILLVCSILMNKPIHSLTSMDMEKENATHPLIAAKESYEYKDPNSNSTITVTSISHEDTISILINKVDKLQKVINSIYQKVHAKVIVKSARQIRLERIALRKKLSRQRMLLRKKNISLRLMQRNKQRLLLRQKRMRKS